jgi:hypothetical protein
MVLAGVGLLVSGCVSVHVSGSAPPQRSPASVIGAPSRVTGSGVTTRVEPGCTTASQPGRVLPATATAMTSVPSPKASHGVEITPFGVAISAGGRWAFASLGAALGVLQLSPGHPATLVRTVALPVHTAGAALTPNGRLLVLAGGPGAVVISVRAAESGHGRVVLGELAAPARGRAGAIEVTTSPDSRYAFVSLEGAGQIAVFDLAKALARGFGAGAYVGAVPTQLAPVGLAMSPDGRWLYSTSEAVSLAEVQRNISASASAGEIGTLEVVNVRKAESDPAAAVVARVTAGCNPVRVVTSADGGVVWVTARESDALLAFSAAELRTSPSQALLADVQVGEAPVGLALASAGSLVVVADSNRFDTAGSRASLAVVSVADALAGRPALVGYLPAGEFPRDMAASPDGSTVLVANYASAQLETVNASDLP